MLPIVVLVGGCSSDEAGGTGDAVQVTVPPLPQVNTTSRAATTTPTTTATTTTAVATTPPVVTTEPPVYVPPTTEYTPEPAYTPPAPVYTPPPVEVPESVGGVVHPGSFCDVPGLPGVTNKGTAMVCGIGSDGRLRWKSS
ncbi:putative secreted protein [Rhodococcus sp. AW25M09]|nr:putative secreted protein [Rhodococcus sp. AW25M09]